MSLRKLRRFAAPGALTFGSVGLGLLPAGGDWTKLGVSLLAVSALWAITAVVSYLVDRGDDALADRIDAVADQVEQWASDRKRADPGFHHGSGEEAWERMNEEQDRHRRETHTSWVHLAGRIAPLIDEAARRGYRLDGEYERVLDPLLLASLAGASPEIGKLSALRVLAARVRRGDKT
jgi:hypothetical protein